MLVLTCCSWCTLSHSLFITIRRRLILPQFTEKKIEVCVHEVLPDSRGLLSFVDLGLERDCGEVAKWRKMNTRICSLSLFQLPFTLSLRSWPHSRFYFKLSMVFSKSEALTYRLLLLLGSLSPVSSLTQLSTGPSLNPFLEQVLTGTHISD